MVEEIDNKIKGTRSTKILVISLEKDWTYPCAIGRSNIFFKISSPRYRYKNIRSKAEGFLKILEDLPLPPPPLFNTMYNCR